jgi:hypothetical protein
VTPEPVFIDRRFNGPAATANGGYACGVVAGAIGPAARVNLRAPPPLEVPLTWEQEDGTTKLLDGETLIAEGVADAPTAEPATAPTLDEARAAAERYAGRDPEDHRFPTCFVCGPLRVEDGLGIFPGPVTGSELLACPWTPGADLAGGDGTVAPVFVWAALDCPSGFACMPPGKTSMLASMTGEIRGPVEPGREYVMVAYKLGSEGRKHRAVSAVHDSDGNCLALAEALWITLAADGQDAG